MDRANIIRSRLEVLRAEVAGRAKIIAVSKYYPASDIRLAYEAGQRDFGESRVQELQQKAAELNDLDIVWHFIGHLQTNKIRPLFSIKGLGAVHAVDSQRLFEAMLKEEILLSAPLDFYLQVNTSAETQKHGMTTLNEVQSLIDRIEQVSPKNLIFKGLMTMGPAENENFEIETGRCFRDLAQLRDGLKGPRLELSMGMSQDYRIALKYGSNALRIGSFLFEN